MKAFLFVYLTIGEVLFFVALGPRQAMADLRRLKLRHGRVKAWFMALIAFQIFILLWPVAVYRGIRAHFAQRGAR